MAYTFNDLAVSAGLKPKPNKESSNAITVGSGDTNQNVKQHEAASSVYTGGTVDAYGHHQQGENKKAVASILTGGINDANVTMGGKDITDSLFGTNPLAKKSIGGVPQVTAPGNVGVGALPVGFAAQTVTGAPLSFQGAQIGAAPQNLVGAQIGVEGGAGSMTAYQNQLAHDLALRASGQGPSIVDQQAAQARQQNQAAIMAQLASARGGANPLAARTAMQANVQGNAQLDRDTMMAKIQEQQQAQQLLGQVAGQGRASDIQQATSQAQLQQEAALNNYKGQLDRAVAQGQLDQRTAETMFTEAGQNARLNAQMGQAFNDSRMKYMQMGLDADKANQMAALEVEKLRQSGALGQAGLNVAANAANKQMASGVLNGLAGIASTYFTGSPAAGQQAVNSIQDTPTDNGTYDYGNGAGAGTGPLANGAPTNQLQSFDSSYRAYGNQGDGTAYRDPYMTPGGK